MARKETKTIIGIPIYDGENPNVVKTCLENVGNCIDNLNVEAEIVVALNGPKISHGQKAESCGFDFSSKHQVTILKTRPGLVAAEKAICQFANNQDVARVFLTDADISRFPNSLHNMWEQGDKPVVGANYSTYPPQIIGLVSSGFSPEELTLMRIFEADKHPRAREFTWHHRPEKRLKGSLLLVDPQTGIKMFGQQGITSDSRMNQIIPHIDKQIINNAAFMHHARIDLKDHVHARLRHFRAAAAEGDLESCYRKSLIYSPETADNIALSIRLKHNDDQVASDFLLQSALRHRVASICKTLASNKIYYPPQIIHNPTFDLAVKNFKEALLVIDSLLFSIDFNNIDKTVSDGKCVTQIDQRIPIDLTPFLASLPHRRILLSHLGLEEGVNV